ncbi:site-specific integrase [Brevundimonas sp. VNH65]|uniref:site-specific integrase n=1 Tax=Brevundimonas sp. VNH65 TaxID=3400917 RepID=UPI003BFC63B8
MPPPRKPPRLLLRRRTGRPAVYVILDQGFEVSTGCGPDRQREAEEALAAYLAAKHQPDFSDGDPRKVAVADCLIYYDQRLPDDHKGPEPTHIMWLADYFGEMTCHQINEDTCRAYVTARTTGTLGHMAVKESTAKRELETLSAALNATWKAGKLDRPIPVWKPEGDEQEARWLTRDEAARLIRGALGFKPTGFDEHGRVTGYERVAAPQYHVARFIILGLYSATRHAAILGLRWDRNPTSGSVDLKEQRIYRRGTEERQTRKRRNPCPIPKRLLPHLRRWRRLTVIGPCEYAGKLIQRQKTGFEAARVRAMLGDDITPHTLKHTAITWMLQKGVAIWEVAGFSSTSSKLIERRYGHHCPDHMENARNAFSRRGPKQ